MTTAHNQVQVRLEVGVTTGSLVIIKALINQDEEEHAMTTRSTDAPNGFPDIFQRYVDKFNPGLAEMPRFISRRFHGRDVPLWQGLCPRG